jgi:GNAT superfamily N-acetyltransferase
MPLSITAVDSSDPDAVALRESHRTELVARYGGDGETNYRTGRPDLAILLLARDRATGVPVACGGLHPLGDGVAEIKQMFVVPDRRGEGLSRHLLAALEAEADVLGWHVLRLEAGPRQPEAIALYGRSGYVRIANSGPYLRSDDAVRFEKRLPRSGP